MASAEKYFTISGQLSRDDRSLNASTRAKELATAYSNSQESRHDLTPVEKAVELLDSDKLTDTEEAVLQILVNKFPYIAPYSSFSVIWPDITNSSNPNMLQSVIRRLRDEKSLAITCAWGRGYSLTDSPHMENGLHWMSKLTLQEEEIINYCLNHGGQMTYHEFASLLGDDTSRDPTVNKLEHKQLFNNAINSARSRLGKKLENLNVGSFRRIRGKNIFVLTLYAESLQQAAD